MEVKVFLDNVNINTQDEEFSFARCRYEYILSYIRNIDVFIFKGKEYCLDKIILNTKNEECILHFNSIYMNKMGE